MRSDEKWSLSGKMEIVDNLDKNKFTTKVYTKKAQE